MQCVPHHKRPSNVWQVKQNRRRYDDKLTEHLSNLPRYWCPPRNNANDIILWPPQYPAQITITVLTLLRNYIVGFFVFGKGLNGTAQNIISMQILQHYCEVKRLGRWERIIVYGQWSQGETTTMSYYFNVFVWSNESMHRCFQRKLPRIQIKKGKGPEGPSTFPTQFRIRSNRTVHIIIIKGPHPHHYIYWLISNNVIDSNYAFTLCHCCWITPLPALHNSPYFSQYNQLIEKVQSLNSTRFLLSGSFKNYSHQKLNSIEVPKCDWTLESRHSTVDRNWNWFRTVTKLGKCLSEWIPIGVDDIDAQKIFISIRWKMGKMYKAAQVLSTETRQKELFNWNWRVIWIFESDFSSFFFWVSPNWTDVTSGANNGTNILYRIQIRNYVLCASEYGSFTLYRFYTTFKQIQWTHTLGSNGTRAVVGSFDLLQQLFSPSPVTIFKR